MVRSNNSVNFFTKYRFEIMLILSILFLLLLFIFRSKIKEWLKNKKECDFGFKKSIISSGRILKKNETRCRAIFESIFGKPFKSVRPDFLKQANGYNLELDGFNRDLNLAWEYNGIQHYKYSPRFHKSPKDLERQILRDNYKRQVCNNLGINLIEIPYTVKYDDLEMYIRDKLNQLGYL